MRISQARERRRCCRQVRERLPYMIIEYGCGQCGTELMTVSFDAATERPANKCPRCGMLVVEVERFAWPVRLKNHLAAEWPDIPMDEMRRQPLDFVESKLNPWLAQRGESPVVVDHEARPITLTWER